MPRWCCYVLVASGFSRAAGGAESTPGLRSSRWAEQIHPVADDAVRAQIEQALHGPIVIDGVADAAHAQSMDLRHAFGIPQRVVEDHGHAAQVLGDLEVGIAFGQLVD
ncbi:hypothetical protein D3C71_1890490 [compost metagenome]